MTEISPNIFKEWVVVAVDDDPSSLDVASSLLRYAGATVHTAENGQAGLALVRQIKPHLVLTDLSMPIMDGWGLIENLKRDITTADIPIVALTAHAMLGDREKAIAAGCHNYLTKPLTPEDFITGLVNIVTDIPALAHLLTSPESKENMP